MTTPVSQISAIVLLVLLVPVLAALALLILAVDRHAPLYLAGRIGRDGQPFRMAKFRTMRRTGKPGSAITSVGDARVTALGKVLRNTKLDELPQLFNIARGEMAMFGPRPEDPGIVERCYTAEMRRSLEFKPGLLSPGTLWTLRNFRKMENASDPESAYARDILPKRLAIDAAYFRDATAAGNLHLALETAAFLLKRIGSAETRE